MDNHSTTVKHHPQLTERGMFIGITRFHIAVAIAGALGGLLEGFDAGVISGALLFLKKTFALTRVLQEIAVTSVLVGALIGAIIAGPLSNAIGRRRVMLLGAVIFAVFALTSAIAPTLPLFLFSRFVIGIAVGLVSVVGSLYVSELVPPAVRGILVAGFQIALSFGLTAAYWVDYSFARFDHGNWHAMFAVGIIPAVAMLVIVWMLPDTPRWHMMRGRPIMAAQIMNVVEPDPARREEDLATMETELKQERGRFSEFFQNSGLRQSLWFGIGLGLIQQLTGINIVVYYSPILFQMAGLQTPSTAILVTAVIGVVTLIATISIIFFVDRVGRKPSLLVSLAGISFAMLMLGILFAVKSFVPTQDMGVAAFIIILLYHIFFAFGVGPLFWVYVAEIYPLRFRGIGTSTSHTVAWAGNIVVSMTFLSLVKALGAVGTFTIYTIICILAFFFIWGWAPETRGHRLEDMMYYWTHQRQWPNNTIQAEQTE